MSDECTRLLSPLPRPNYGSRPSGTPRWQVFQQSDEDVYHENDNDNDSDSDSDNGSHHDDRSSGGGSGIHRSQPQRQPKQVQQLQQQQQQQVQVQVQQHQQQPVQHPQRPTNHHRDSMITMGPIVGVSKPIKKWYRGLIVRQSCHNRLASDFLARDTHLSTLSVVLTALTSSAIFVSLTPLASATGDELAMELEASTSTTISSISSTAGASAWSQILAVLAGTIAACNTVLQGITRTLYYGQRGERHLRAYREYSVLRFQLENIVGDKPRYAEHKVDRTRLEAWIRSYEEVLEESPTIPQQVFDRVASEQDRKGLSWTKDDREVRAIIDEERKLAAIRESKLMSSDPSLFSP